MSTLEIMDFLIGVAFLAVVPLFLAAYGGHLAAQTLPDSKMRRRAKGIFWGLFILGVGLAALYQYRIKKVDDARELKAALADSERQRKLDEAQKHALEAQAELKGIEKANGAQIGILEKRVDGLISSAQSSEEKLSAQQIKNDLAELEKRLNKDDGLARPPVSVSPPAADLPSASVPVKECRGDDLRACSDQELLKWGKPLVEKVEKIEAEYMAALNALDDITGSWAGFLFGKDKDSKWVKAYATAQQNTADEFRNCCAENVLRYHNELISRVGDSLADNEPYDWVGKLLKPIKSKELKEARSDAGKIIRVMGDLHRLEFLLSTRPSRTRLPQSSH